MKKLFTLLFISFWTAFQISYGQGVENFNNYPETSNAYHDGTFTGQDGSTWQYFQCRGDSVIIAPSPTLGKNRTPISEVKSGSISNGCGTLSFDYKQPFTSAVSLNVYVNNIMVYTATTSAGEQGLVKHSGPITVNQSGQFIIDFIQASTASGQVTIDNITWTAYESTPPPFEEQVIADFEVIPMNMLLGGADDQSYIDVIPNPDPTGINTSAWVAHLNRDKDGVPWCGFWSKVGPTDSVDVTVNKFVHVKVWKPRISPLHFKLEGGSVSPTTEITSMYPQTVINGWEDIVFDFRALTGKFNIVVLCPDFNDPVSLTEDIQIYFDDIMVNNDSVPATASAYTIENFEELIPLNLMLGGAEDLSKMSVVWNPDPTGINTSNWVVKFVRDKDGVPWGGFWSALPTPVDVTVTKFAHVKVWKPRISPIWFKIEGGAAGTIERPSTNPQTLINIWEDITTDFSEKTGTYPIIAFMPDKQDPVNLTEDIVIYFDDIIFSTDSLTPTTNVTINVDMSGAGLITGDKVYVSGDFGGIYGTWDQPGNNANNELINSSGNIYTIAMALPDGQYHFKFFKNAGWTGGEWNGDPNRAATVAGTTTLNYKFGVKPANVTFNVNMKHSGLNGEPIFVAGNFGGIYGVWNEPGTNLNDQLISQIPLSDSIYQIVMALDSVGTYQLKFFKGSGWAGGEWAGDPNRHHTINQDTIIFLQWGCLNPQPVITIQPQSQTVCYGNNLTFFIYATGLEPLHYQWQKNQINIDSADQNILHLFSVDNSDQGQYRCIVSNTFGAVTSQEAYLTVHDTPAPTQMFGNTTPEEYEICTYSVTETPENTYSFSVMGGNEIGHTTNSMTVVWGCHGIGHIFLVETTPEGCSGDTVDLEINIQVHQIPIILVNPISQSVCANENVFFSVGASGVSPLNYQWQKDGTDIPDANDSLFSIPNVTSLNQGGYRCIVSNINGADTSETAYLVVETISPSEIIGPRHVEEFEVSTYSVNYQPYHIYDFYIVGGNPIDHNYNSITVQWLLSGYGYVFLVETNNISGCIADTVSIEVLIGSVGINDNSPEKITLIPNPVANKIHIKNIRE